MSKKVLGIVGSPRKGGNTDILVDTILQSASMAGGTTQKIYLNNLNIKHCQECLHCHHTNPKECAIKDDMSGVVEAMNTADVLVLGTPIFWWGPSGLFKDFVDRWYGFDIDFKSKKIILVYPSGDPDKQVARFFRGMMEDALAYEGTEAYAFVQAAGANDSGDVANITDVMEYAREVGANCVK